MKQFCETQNIVEQSFYAGARHKTGNQAAVLSPVEPDPGSIFNWLVLQVRGLGEVFVAQLLFGVEIGDAETRDGF